MFITFTDSWLLTCLLTKNVQNRFFFSFLRNFIFHFFSTEVGSLFCEYAIFVLYGQSCSRQAEITSDEHFQYALIMLILCMNWNINVQYRLLVLHFQWNAISTIIYQAVTVEKQRVSIVINCVELIQFCKR